MTVIQNAWQAVCSFEWLLYANMNARKGKRYRLEVMAFAAKLPAAFTGQLESAGE